MYCKGCGKVCEQKLVDFGVGKYEFWGRVGFDTDKRYVSDCCEETVYENEDLTIEEDNPDPEADRADYLYDMRREES